MRAARAALLLIVGATITAPVSACASSERDAGTATGEQQPTDATLRVFAASSLTESFKEIAAEFEDENPGVDVMLTFAGSSALAQQIDAGAEADVFVPADEESLAAVVDAGHAADRVIVARNRLVILVEKGNPKRIRGVADLALSGVVVVACAPQVPCGRLAAALFAFEGVEVTPASIEENVKGVVSKITLGEADAGIVYATDAKAVAAGADAVAIAAADRPDLQAVYPAVVTANAKDGPLARRWIQHLLSARSQVIFERHGFLPA
ncbi:MAG TPA: molybdate ABC transporter substrate-binding protein [Acidimicrobiales bacterium]|nr:molybdate ABC transporter substrate-binding protein [Acidimicrobiales bacterium]